MPFHQVHCRPKPDISSKTHAVADVYVPHFSMVTEALPTFHDSVSDAKMAVVPLLTVRLVLLIFSWPVEENGLKKVAAATNYYTADQRGL